jgi:LCP family protein required for cell wall assembly
MPRRRAPSRRPAGRRRRLSALSWLSIFTTMILIAGSLAAYAAFHDIYGQLDQESIDTDAFEDRPDPIEGVVNVMIIGSDVRTGENAEYGDAEGERPDTLIIAHLSPSYEGATLINIPRDSIVDMPGCDATDDRPGMPPSRDMIGVALTLGGPACLWDTVEQLTGIHIDHYVHMDFTGFVDMVDALGGVEMCIPEPIDDPQAHLELDAGNQLLNGEESLGYVRARYSLGDGSDLGRIERQQEFMGAMARKVTSSEVMTSPSSIHSFLGAVAQSVTTDDELTVDTMADIAISMREADMGDIEFITVPSGEDPMDPNRVTWTQPEADQLFQAIAQDEAIDDEGGGEESEEDAEDGGQEEPPPDVNPAEVSVEVLNGTETSGLAAQVADELAAEGFAIAGTGNPLQEVPSSTTVYYGPGNEDQARAVAHALDGAETQENPELGVVVQVILSTDQGDDGGSGEGGTDTSEDSRTAADVNDDACG